MKHLFYLFYVLGYSGAVFITGMFVGQILERRMAIQDQKARQAARGSRENSRQTTLDPVGIPLQDVPAGRTGEGK